MIQELVSLANNLRQNKLKGTYIHDALDKVPTSIDLVIGHNGKFKQFIVHEPVETITEAITAKKGKARLLVDRSEEILNIGKEPKSKHKLFMEKLANYPQLFALTPVMAFYQTNKEAGINKARSEFLKQVDEKQRGGNISFIVDGSNKRLHEDKEIRKAIIDNYKSLQEELKNKRFPVCSICGSSEYAVTDLPHGMIKRVPDGQTAGCALVSYNENAYESYGFKWNENSSICTHCARAYVDALNWLLSPSSWEQKEKKGKAIPIFKNRKNISTDTAVVFWLQDAVEISEIEMLDKPDEGEIREMIKGIESGEAKHLKNLHQDIFYSIILSGSAARIAIRDWIITSISNLRKNLALWFSDIEIGEYSKEQGKIVYTFPRFWELVKAAKGKSTNDVQHGRIGAALWKCAILGTQPPLWILSAVLNRIKAEQGNATSERIALLKLIINRKTNQSGGKKIMSGHDETNKNIAYTCGGIFAVMESIQYHASGGNLNAGIRERFFSFASTMPATAFGRLMKLTQHHLSKIRGEKPGL
ncbi:MAG: type I-C CRISPR-associated protein Cas8c/Csd1, partial [Bacteroidetes bacterium]|nr:type I-C CRISPR-associated protein Cas8c/Csd1 [Bacteroidota bacterium]